MATPNQNQNQNQPSLADLAALGENLGYSTQEITDIMEREGYSDFNPSLYTTYVDLLVRRAARTKRLLKEFQTVIPPVECPPCPICGGETEWSDNKMMQKIYHERTWLCGGSAEHYNQYKWFPFLEQINHKGEDNAEGS